MWTKNRLHYDEFANLISEYDILSFTETKTDDTDSLQIPGFVTYMKNRHKLSNIRSGGIIVAIKDNIAKHINVIDTDCKFIMWLKISKVLFNVDKDVICGVVYIPPEASKYSSNDSFMKIEQELFNFSKDSNYFCFMGDLNSRVGRLGDFVEPDDF